MLTFKVTICLLILTFCFIQTLIHIGFKRKQHYQIDEIDTDKHTKYITKNWRYIKSTRNKYLLKPNSVCNPECSIVFAICSGLDHFENRRTIRETWGKNIGFEINIFFVVGMQKVPNSKVQKRLLDEHRLYRDILQADFIDTYQNLTLKSVAMLQWCIRLIDKAKYLLKIDDDMYVNISNLLSVIRKINTGNVIAGYLVKGTRPVLNPKSKFYTPLTTYPYLYYPSYLSGTGYLISMSVVRKLYDVCSRLQFLWIEDVFITGICAPKANIKLINMPDFGIGSPNGCLSKFVITGHRVAWTDMHAVHKDVLNDSYYCSPQWYE